MRKRHECSHLWSIHQIRWRIGRNTLRNREIMILPVWNRCLKSKAQMICGGYVLFSLSYELRLGFLDAIPRNKAQENCSILSTENCQSIITVPWCLIDAVTKRMPVTCKISCSVILHLHLHVLCSHSSVRVRAGERNRADKNAIIPTSHPTTVQSIRQ